MTDKHICQVALCALNAANLRDWYQQVFGMVKAGMIATVPPMPTTRIQGVTPNPVETVSWLVDQQDYFQLEFFQFYRPQPKPRPVGWRMCDIGYNMLGVYARDFDKVLHRIAACSDSPLAEPVGPAGERRLCLQDPEGNWIELLEADPMARMESDPMIRPELLCATRFIRVSVPQLEAARRTFVDTMGLTEVEDYALHSPEHEAQWGLAGATTRTALLSSRNFLVELVEYQSHQPRLRPDGYQICDQGYMNIAFGYRTTKEFNAEFARVTQQGLTPNGKPVDIGIFRVMYVNDPQGFSIEMLNPRRSLWSFSGFNPSEPYVQNEILVNASIDKTWRALIDHKGLSDWSAFNNSKVIRPGAESPNGPGCLRELALGGMRLTEEIVSWEEGKHYTYKLRTGAPFSWHQGDVFVSDEGGRTRVRWAVRFQSRIPFSGKLLAIALQFLFRNALGRLKLQLEAKG